ncbi:hypothetical protein [Variovorax sp. SRS16]|nr:hypothetical protein [Variovorax sp. SRS16]
MPKKRDPKGFEGWIDFVTPQEFTAQLAREASQADGLLAGLK